MPESSPFADTPPYPGDLPASVPSVLDEPRFEAARHLALETPAEVWSLADFGYTPAETAASPSPVAVTSPFRILTEEGVATLQAVLRSLLPYADRSIGRRLSTFLRRSVQRSAFVRGLVGDPSLLEHLSAIAGTPLSAHSIPGMQSFVNYAPLEPGRSVDSWHVDSIGFDAVLMVSDPSSLDGGRFQYFRGTRGELAQRIGLATEGELVLGHDAELPADRVVEAAFPAAGYAVFMQGDMVFHRAAPLHRPGERMTLVAGFLARALDYPDRTNTAHMQNWRDPDNLVDVARHAAWLSQQKLARLVERLSYVPGHSRLAIAEALEGAVADSLRVAEEMRAAAQRETDT